MLTLGTNLIAELKNKATEACWLLDLYYNDDDDATKVIHLSDKDRTVGGVDYIGIVRSWGSLHHAADLVEFVSSTGTIAIVLDNTEHAIAGGRFTDLFADKNFVNRKWDLYLSDGTNKSTDSIGSGVISGDIKVTDRQAEIYLLNYESKFSDTIPTAKVTSANFAYAPTNNIDKPIPMSYGDFSRSSTDVTTNLCRTLVKGHFPAIITHETNIDAKCDRVAMNDLQATNLYMYLGTNYAACDSLNVTATAAPGTPATGYNFQFGGHIWYLGLPITTHNDINTEGTDVEDLYDEDVTSSGTLASDDDPDAGKLATYTFELRPIAEAGTFTAMWLGIDKDSVSGATGELKAYYLAYTGGNYGAALTLSWDTTDEFEVVPRDGTDTFPQEGALLKLTMRDTGEAAPHSMDVNEINLQIGIKPTETFLQRIDTTYEYRTAIKLGQKFRYVSGFGIAHERHYVVERISHKMEINAPANIEYVYCSGQGRIFGAWIDADSRNNGYNEDDLIGNPIYIAEDALRTEASKATADIDITSFDAAGNTTDGLIKDVFNDSIADIKFAFSQYKISDLFSFCEKLGHQCGAIFFISGNAKMKVAVRRRPSDYSAGDEVMEIDYNDISNISYKQTSIGDVRNDITVKYAYDYVREETIESINPAADATSYGDGLTGYNQQLYLEEEMDCCLDAVTADNYADALQAWHKDRHFIIKFETALPRYQALEIGDVIEFLNWDSGFMVYGTIPTTTDLFMVQDITKSGPDRTLIEVMECS